MPSEAQLQEFEKNLATLQANNENWELEDIAYTFYERTNRLFRQTTNLRTELQKKEKELEYTEQFIAYLRNKRKEI